jgi:hypothetical protein
MSETFFKKMNEFFNQHEDERTVIRDLDLLICFLVKQKEEEERLEMEEINRDVRGLVQ